MDKYSILDRIKQIYAKNENVIKYLKQLDNRSSNTTEDILISYDFQAGSYTDAYRSNPDLKNTYSQYLAEVIDQLGDNRSIMEAGVGEATTLGNIVSYLSTEREHYYGFDISWSRIKYARRFLASQNRPDAVLFTGDLFSAPLMDRSIDIVYTSHSIEPNGGRESEALQELYRIANRYLVLLEPSYELADEGARARMREHGYVTRLYDSAKELGYDVIEHRLFEVSANPMNPTGLIVIRKDDPVEIKSQPLCCPISRTELVQKGNVYYSESSLLAYPIVEGIPCLLPQNAILATKFLD